MTKELKLVVIGGVSLLIVGIIVTIILVVSSGSDYEQNSNPDYQAFAHSYANAAGIDNEFAIQITLPLSQKLGDTICGKLREGVTEKQLTDRLTGSGSEYRILDRVQSASIVNAAHNYICSGK